MFFRLKYWFDQNKGNVFLGLLIFFIATIAFGLGYLTAEQGAATRAPIVIEKLDSSK